MERRAAFIVYPLLILAVLANIGLQLQVRTARAHWENVPPAPSLRGALGFSLGDREFSYRIVGYMLQNFGNGGGRFIALKDYDFNNLAQWLFLAGKLDPVSDFAPHLAAFYFGATQNPKMLPPIIDYLAAAGREPGPEKWRWLAQAVYLARFRLGDFNRALQLANELSAMWRPGMPIWMREMPVFVMTAKGDKRAAYGLMLQMLKDEVGKVSQPEINSTIAYICQSILSDDEALQTPLCTANMRFMSKKFK